MGLCRPARPEKTSPSETGQAVLFDERTNAMNIFPLGQIVGTPAALEAIAEAGQPPEFFLDKHGHGDWGELCEEDKQLNDQALLDGGRLLSAYKTLKGERIWIITEAIDDDGQRNATTILLPSQY
jgi:hypothetical protein